MQRLITALFLTAYTASAETTTIQCDATVLPDCVAENKVCSDGRPMFTYGVVTGADTGELDCACNTCGVFAVCGCNFEDANDIPADYPDGTTCATLCPGEPTPGPTKSTDDSDDSGNSGASFVSISLAALVPAAVAFVFQI